MQLALLHVNGCRVTLYRESRLSVPSPSLFPFFCGPTTHLLHHSVLKVIVFFVGSVLGTKGLHKWFQDYLSSCDLIIAKPGTKKALES